MIRKNYVPELDQSYRFENGAMIFEDGVQYTVQEAVLLSKGNCSPLDLQAIHEIKKLFGGSIIALNDMLIEEKKRTIEDFRLQASCDRRNSFYRASEMLQDLEDTSLTDKVLSLISGKSSAQ